MATMRGCAFPDHLRYDVANHLWYEPLGHGTARIGMTVVAGALGREVLAFTPKRVGRRFDAGRSCAPIESGKWIGQARAAFAGTVVALNDALIQRSSLANRDRLGLPLPSTRRCLSATARRLIPPQPGAPPRPRRSGHR